MKNKYTNKYIIETGIGLQDVDKLKNSSYFISESNRYINGEITLDELDNIVIKINLMSKIEVKKPIK